MAVLDRASVLRMARRQGAAAHQDLRQPADTPGWHMEDDEDGCRKIRRQSRTTRCSASTPPADAPTTIMSAVGIDTIVSLPLNREAVSPYAFIAAPDQGQIG